LGTGNYNRDTAMMYEDVGLLTSDDELGADVSDLFNLLTGYSRQREYRKLLVAPLTLRQAMRDLIRRESRPGGRITIKVNSLVDSEMINALYQAAQAGAAISLLLRGICGLRPGVQGMSDGITVRSIVGRVWEAQALDRVGAAD